MMPDFSILEQFLALNKDEAFFCHSHTVKPCFAIQTHVAISQIDFRYLCVGQPDCGPEILLI